MIAIDTSIWIDHFRKTDTRLAALTTSGRVWQHPFVTGELAVGSFPNRDRTLVLLRSLPKVLVAPEEVIYDVINDMGLVGSGLGFVDVHILAALQRTPSLQLWTRDKRLAEQANILGRLYQPD